MTTTGRRQRLLRGMIALLVAAAVVSGGLLLHAVSGTQDDKAHEGHGQAAVKNARFHCPMHPSYISDKPGNCPICGMALVPMTEKPPQPSKIPGRAIVNADNDSRDRIGLVLGKALRRPFKKTIRATGRVEADERRISTVNLKFSGWIQKLFVSAVGDVVEKGTPLFEIYSPELLDAQRSYLIAFEARKRDGADGFAERNLKSARERLLLWDLTEDQIGALETQREPMTRVPILSKVDGIVTRRNILQGGYVQTGVDLYEIVNLSDVWVRGDVYEYELGEIRLGMQARITFSSFPGETFLAKVIYVATSVNEQTRAVGVRLELPNRDGRLRPGMYATVALDIDLGEQVVVNESAVLDSGVRQIVFVDLGEGKLEPREVTIGARSDGHAVVLRGLDAGEPIVLSGNFLLDSESRLKGALLPRATAETDRR